MEYGITDYPDVEQLYKKLNALIAQPIRPVRRERMQEYLEYFNTEVRPFQGAELTRLRSSSRAGCSTTWLSTTHSRSPSKRRRAPSCGMRTATGI